MTSLIKERSKPFEIYFNPNCLDPLVETILRSHRFVKCIPVSGVKRLAPVVVNLNGVLLNGAGEISKSSVPGRWPGASPSKSSRAAQLDCSK
jgi:hypothetical protein